MTDALSRAQANSPFLAQLIERQPELVALLDKGDFEGALAMALSAGVDDDIAATLRRQRQGVALVTAIADLAGVWIWRALPASCPTLPITPSMPPLPQPLPNASPMPRCRVSP